MLSFAFAQRALTHPSFGQYSITTMNNLLLEWTTYFQNSGRTITIPEGTIPILNTTTNACTVLKIDETFTEIFTLYFLVAKKDEGGVILQNVYIWLLTRTIRADSWPNLGEYLCDRLGGRLCAAKHSIVRFNGGTSLGHLVWAHWEQFGSESQTAPENTKHQNGQETEQKQEW